MQINSIFKKFENISVEKKTLSTALEFEPRSFDCRLFNSGTWIHCHPSQVSALLGYAIWSSHFALGFVCIVRISHEVIISFYDKGQKGSGSHDEGKNFSFL